MTRKAARWGDFARLWAALSVSLMGTEITALALPLLAALTLGASALEMGILAAAGQVPFLLFSLPAGAWVDRLPRRPVLIAADVASALLLLSVPLAVPLGGPNFAHLCVVAFGVGTMTVVSEVAHYAYVPTLVGRERLTESNSRLQVSYSAAAAAGPGLAGALVQLLSAPVAVLADAVSFLVSAVLLRSIRRPEPPPVRSDAGCRCAGRSPTGCGSCWGIPCCGPSSSPRCPSPSSPPASSPSTCSMPPATSARPGDDRADLRHRRGRRHLGRQLAGRAAARFGVGPAIIGGWVLAAAAALLVPLAAGPTVAVVAILALSKTVEGITDTVANIHQWSLRQVVTPDHLAGRVTAGHRFAVYGAGAAGALAGGALGTAVGLRPALLVCAVGALLSPLLALCSPLRQLRQQPTSDRLTF